MVFGPRGVEGPAFRIPGGTTSGCGVGRPLNKAVSGMGKGSGLLLLILGRVDE